MSDDSFLLPASPRSGWDRLARDRHHRERLDQADKHHREQLEATKAKSARELAAEAAERSAHELIEKVRAREAGLTGEYQQRWQRLESEFPERVRAAADPIIQEELDRALAWGETVRELVRERSRHLDEKQERIKASVEHLRNWHKELRSWQDKMNAYNGHVLGIPRDPELADKPDEKAAHRDDVESDVAAAVKEHSENV